MMEITNQPKQRKAWIFLAGLGCGVCLTAYLGLVALSGLGLLAVDKLTHLMIFGIGSKAPKFILRNLSFEKVRLEQKLDKPLLLNFGTTWCPFCGEETKTLQQLQEYYPDLNVMSVYIMEDAKTVCEYVLDNKLSYTFLLDRDASVAIDYKVWAIPSTFFIDTQGIIQAHYEGLMGQDELNEGLERLGITP